MYIIIVIVFIYIFCLVPKMVCQDLFVFFCSAINQNYSTKAQRSSGCIYFGNFPNYMELDIWVDVENVLGKVRSDVLFIIDPNEMGKWRQTNIPNALTMIIFFQSLMVCVCVCVCDLFCSENESPIRRQYYFREELFQDPLSELEAPYP